MQTASKPDHFGGHTTQNFVALLVAVLILRLVSLYYNNSELFFDEAQYWAWAQDLEFGYFSKPPMLAWIISLFTGICGSDSAFCIRLPAPMLHTATAFTIFLIGRHLFDQRTGFWAGIVFATLPAVSLSSTLISTDVPLMFFWSVALFSFLKLDETKHLKWGLVLGLALGMGLLAKYAMAYFFLCFAVYAFGGQQYRSIVKTNGFWIAILIALLILSPNIWWNLQNGFTTLTHTGENIGWKGLSLHPLKAAEFVLSQFGVFGPVLMGVFLYATWKSFPFSQNKPAHFLLSFSLPILVLIIIQALMSKAYANWAALTYVAATVLVTDFLINRLPAIYGKISLALHALVFVMLALAVTRAGPGQLMLPGNFEPFARTQGAGELAGLIAVELDKGNYKAVITTDRKMSSLLTYGLRDRTEKILAWRRGVVPDDYFEQKKSFQQTPMEPALVIKRKRGIKNLRTRFSKVTTIGPVTVNSGETRKLTLFRVEGYIGNGELN